MARMQLSFLSDFFVNDTYSVLIVVKSVFSSNWNAILCQTLNVLIIKMLQLIPTINCPALIQQVYVFDTVINQHSDLFRSQAFYRIVKGNFN